MPFSCVPLKDTRIRVPVVADPELPEPLDDLQYLPLEASVGGLALPPQPADKKELASSWPQALLGRRGARLVEPEDYLATLNLCAT